MTNKSFALSSLFLVISMVIGITILVGLGTWQVQRLHWKEALIAEVTDRIKHKPVQIDQALDEYNKSGDVEYLPVTVTGRFKHDSESHYYNTLDGQVGWNIITPLVLSDQRVVLINRGFVPDALKEQSTRSNDLPKAEITITGLARNPVVKKPNQFVPENEPSKNRFFWKDQTALLRHANLSERLKPLPFIIDQGIPGKAESTSAEIWPRPGTTRISFPNNHLQYAFTWYGLALALLGVGSYFLYARRNASGGSEHK